MTAYEILEDIVTMYDRHNWESDIAKKYNVSVSTISFILYQCGFYRGKRVRTISLVDALRNVDVRNICEKISCTTN